MSNKEYQIKVIIAGVVVLKTDYHYDSKEYADIWFRNIAAALKGVKGARIVLYSREVPVEKIEQQLKGGE